VTLTTDPDTRRPAPSPGRPGTSSPGAGGSGAERTGPLVAAGIGALAVSLVVLALLVPDRTVGADGGGMSMTHYMGLLSASQPWNLLVFMAVPVVLAETLAITELVILFAAAPPAWVRALNRWAGLLAGPVMLAITVHLLRYAVVPLTLDGGWRGPADVVAVTAYLAGVIPLLGITLVELGALGRDARDARRWHATFVAVFLVVAHVAMIAGMLDPTVLGWDGGAAATHSMPDGSTMPGMEH
jgi:hypothetical protein